MIVVSKIMITKEDRDSFKKTANGKHKYHWLIFGAFIDFFASISICLLIIFSNRIYNALIFYFLLYALFFIMVLGGESIGVYYGALEQYVLHKKEKKEISYME